MRWSVINGFVDVNFFEGMKLKIQVHKQDERDRFEDKELKQIFNKQNYISFNRSPENTEINGVQ